MHKTKVYLYCLFDNVSGSTLYYNVAENDSRAILKLLHSTRIPLAQSTVLRLGELITEIPPVEPDSEVSLDFRDVLKYTFYDVPIKVLWSACTLPENEAEALAPLGLSPSEVSEIVRKQQQKINLVR